MSESTLESYVQLHEDITIWYVVDGYQAIYSVQDDAYQVAKAKGGTIEQALSNLLDILRTKTLQEWRVSK